MRGGGCTAAWGAAWPAAGSDYSMSLPAVTAYSCTDWWRTSLGTLWFSRWGRIILPSTSWRWYHITYRITGLLHLTNNKYSILITRVELLHNSEWESLIFLPCAGNRTYKIINQQNGYKQWAVHHLHMFATFLLHYFEFVLLVTLVAMRIFSWYITVKDTIFGLTTR